jgi:hypothetical protein
MLRPRKVVLSHHDDWSPTFSIPIDTAPIAAELARVVPAVEWLEIGYLDSTPIFR